jgi:hypothetical protein
MRPIAAEKSEFPGEVSLRIPSVVLVHQWKHLANATVSPRYNNSGE